MVIGTALLVCLSCCTGTDGNGNGDQSTVLDTLNEFVEVWTSGDVDAYEDLLDEGSFTFYFDPSDVGGDIPVSWGFNEEITAYTNLFDAVGPENVEVQLELEDVTEPEEGTDTYMVRDIQYYVRIDTPEFIIIANAFLDLQLSKVNGEWFITDWWDKVTSLLLSGETSWGQIKACFSY